MNEIAAVFSVSVKENQRFSRTLFRIVKSDIHDNPLFLLQNLSFINIKYYKITAHKAQSVIPPPYLFLS